MVKVALDVMGGDKGYKEILKGAMLVKDPEIKIYLVGDQDLISAELKQYSYDKERYEIVHSSEVITMDEEPAFAYKKKRDASISVATRLVKDGICDCVVSAGSTGAQLTAAIFILKRIKTVARPAIIIYFPTPNGIKIFLDGGSTPDCDPINLHQFAIMGKIFGEKYLKMDNPSIGLLNNGSEEKKGSKLYKEAFGLLKEEKEINFVGNVEGKEFPFGNVDIVVCDGFVGNIVLKLMEGFSKMFMGQIKSTIMSKLKYKIGGLILGGAFKEIREKMSFQEYGGMPLVGVDGVSIICHGSSDGETMMYAIQGAKNMVNSHAIEEIGKYFNENN